MTTWLTKFRISAALDSHAPLPQELQSAINESQDLRRFAESACEVDRALKNSAPRREAPDSLHSCIMSAVWRSNHPAKKTRQTRALRWMAAGAVTALALGVFWGVRLSPSRATRTANSAPLSLAAASTTLRLGGNLVREAPAAVMQPMSTEMEALGKDYDNAQKFLIDSML